MCINKNKTFKLHGHKTILLSIRIESPTRLTNALAYFANKDHEKFMTINCSIDLITESILFTCRRWTCALNTCLVLQSMCSHVSTYSIWFKIEKSTLGVWNRCFLFCFGVIQVSLQRTRQSSKELSICEWNEGRNWPVS